jgi:peptidoglycan/xylan/chitin deacetylase (PgdA/CDA1 family)
MNTPTDTVVFTYEWYEEFVDYLVSSGYTFQGYGDELESSSVIFRHDVDWSPRKAVKLAEIEAERGVTSTFFFRFTSKMYNMLEQSNRERLQDIRDLGHEIGVHFSTHQYWDRKPPDSALTERVESLFVMLEEVVDDPVWTVSFHNPPEWVLRESYDGFTSTYEPRFFDEIAYRADSNQRWRDENPFADGVPDTLQVLTHPVLWGQRDAWATDRLREERDYYAAGVATSLEWTDRTWEGTFGFGSGDER